jgi:hypothetical protein
VRSCVGLPSGWAVSGGARTISSNRLEAKLEEEVRCYSAFATGLLPQGEAV